MFSFFKKDPIKKLQKQYDIKLEQAMHAQRNGDIRHYASLTNEADDIYQNIVRIKKEQVE